jgi:t-SNARE complex subunit (syntaxin)
LCVLVIHEKETKQEATKIDRVKSDIDAINYNVDQIGNLHNNALASFNEQQSKQIANELEKIKIGTQQKNMAIKTRIQGLLNGLNISAFIV